MITDIIQNAQLYTAFHPDFAQAIHLLQTLNFAELPDGEYPTNNPNIRLFINNEPMRTRRHAQIEKHNRYIDIQVPLSSAEEYGWIDSGSLKNGLGYNEKRDVEFFNCTPMAWLTVNVGEFIIFFPNDAHAPLVGTEKSIRKAVFKIKA